MATTGGLVRVRIWDGAVRLVHWAIVVAFATSWISVRNGWMEVHLWSGYAMLTLVVFRIIWGFVGSDTARFAAFVRGPGACIAYLRAFLSRRPSHWPGHSPIGALSVVALLALLLAQTLLGLFAIDTDALNSGPLAHLVSFETGRMLTEWHGWIFEALKILAAVHIAAVVYYLIAKGENLIVPMLHGDKRLPSGAGTMAPRIARPILAAALFGVVAVLVWLLVSYPPR
ncbi:MAG: cytochrome b/b6 domain-containing protein [Alphaproteobacteria bacterium]